jgi:hypothetical protein
MLAQQHIEDLQMVQVQFAIIPEGNSIYIH